MPHDHERTNRLLDEIDNLVDASLVRGDQSGTWQGERYDRCSVASFNHPWHYLPVTENLEAMRGGSFGTDEFGQGLVDPDYSYQNDESRILCPGSLFRAPPTNDREWEWCVREWGPKRPNRPSASYTHTVPIPPPLTHRGSKTWRLKSIPGDWDVAVDTEVEFVRSDPNLSGHLRDVPVGMIQKITFKFDNHVIKNPTPEWVHQYAEQVQTFTYIGSDMFVEMQPIVFNFSSMRVWAEPDEMGMMEPQYVDITTNYPIQIHGWWNHLWECTDPDAYATERQGHESDYVIIDEAYEMTNERLRQHVEDARTTGPSREATH